MKTATDEQRLWRALGDPSRRQILDLLRERPRTTGELCGHFEATRFAVMKHLTVLEEAGLVIIERRGRERVNHLNPVPIVEIAQRWTKPFEHVPAKRLLRLRALVEEGDDE